MVTSSSFMSSSTRVYNSPSGKRLNSHDEALQSSSAAILAVNACEEIPGIIFITLFLFYKKKTCAKRKTFFSLVKHSFSILIHYKNPLSPQQCFSKPNTPVPDWEKDPIHNPVPHTLSYRQKRNMRAPAASLLSLDCHTH